MKKYMELTKEVLEKLDECPRCKAKLEQRDRRAIECEVCGLRIRLSSWKADIVITCVIISFGLGILLGFLLWAIPKATGA